MDNLGNIIVLNGTSSSGKTTLAREIQSKNSDIYLLCSLDAFWDMTPLEVPAGSFNFPNMKLALAKSVKALAETGHNVVVDIIFSGKKTYGELKGELADFNMKLIKVDCPLEELNKRELARGDRKLGLAASQIETVHKGVVYDLTVDTSKKTPSECSVEIIKALQ